MKNIEMIQEVYTELTETLWGASEEVINAKKYEQASEILDTMDKISVILKRLGETAIMELGDEPTESNGGEQPLEEHKEEIDVQEDKEIDIKEGDE